MDKETVNKKLLDTFGQDIAGRAKFRVVLSSDELEKRVGRFQEFYGEIFVREFVGAKDVPKYSYLEGEYWVVEHLVPTFNPELTEPMTYEPVFIMMDNDRNPLPLNMDVALIVCNAVLNPKKRSRRSEAGDHYEEEQIRSKEKNANLSRLKSILPNKIQRQLHSKEAIVNPWSGSKNQES